MPDKKKRKSGWKRQTQEWLDKEHTAFSTYEGKVVYMKDIIQGAKDSRQLNRTFKGNKTKDLQICGALKRGTRIPCLMPAGQGTDHLGSGRCKLHGGNKQKMENVITSTLMVRPDSKLGQVLGELAMTDEQIEGLDDEIFLLRGMMVQLLHKEPPKNPDADPALLRATQERFEVVREERVLEILDRVIKSKVAKYKIEKENILTLEAMRLFIAQILKIIANVAGQRIAEEINRRILEDSTLLLSSKIEVLDEETQRILPAALEQKTKDMHSEIWRKEKKGIKERKEKQLRKTRKQNNGEDNGF